MYLGKRLELALGLPFSNTPMTKQNWSESECQSLVSLQDILQGSNNEEKTPATPVGSFIPLAKNWQTKMTDVNHLFKQTGGKKNSFIQQVQASKWEQKTAETLLKTEVVLIQDEAPDQSLFQL